MQFVGKGRFGRKFVPAAADDLDFVVLGMNVRFHDFNTLVLGNPIGKTGARG